MVIDPRTRNAPDGSREIVQILSIEEAGTGLLRARERIWVMTRMFSRAREGFLVSLVIEGI